MKKLVFLCLLLLAPSLSHAAYQSLGKAEDSAAANGDNLIPVGCMREDSAPTSTTSNSGDFSHIKCDSTGAQYVAVSAALPTGSNTIGSVTVLSSGSATALGKLEDNVHNSGDQGIFSLGVIRSSCTTGMGSDGDYVGFCINTSGELVVNANTEMSAAASLGDNTPNPSVPGVAAYMMCFDGTTWDRCQPTVNDTDDNSIAFSQSSSILLSLNYVSNGTAWVRSLPDPCSYLPKTHIPINVSTATTTELTSALAGASTNYYVCSLNLVTAGANNVALVDDDTDNCASVTSGMAGGTTAASGWNFAANGGLAIGNGQGAVFKTVGANRVVCLVTSAATQLSGSISVVAAP